VKLGAETESFRIYINIQHELLEWKALMYRLDSLLEGFYLVFPEEARKHEAQERAKESPVSA
jgi:hypothetical protein